jgi:hypothetical protein
MVGESVIVNGDTGPLACSRTAVEYDIRLNIQIYPGFSFFLDAQYMVFKGN